MPESDWQMATFFSLIIGESLPRITWKHIFVQNQRKYGVELKAPLSSAARTAPLRAQKLNTTTVLMTIVKQGSEKKKPPLAN